MSGQVETFSGGANAPGPSAPRQKGQLGLAFKDISQGIAQAPAWWTLAVHDVRARYRRTLLGPFWIVLSTAIGLTGMAIVWSTLFGMSFTETFPYLSAGFVLWTLLQTIILDACSVYSTGHAVAIQHNLSIPKSFHVLRMVSRDGILFLHNIIVFFFAAIYCQVPFTPLMLMAIPGVLIILLNGVWIGLLFGSIGVRFRDVEPLISSLLTVLFFLTPIVWRTEMLRDRAFIAHYNPFTHFIAIVRDPLLGTPAPLDSWIIVGAVTVIGMLLAIPVFAKARSRLIYWI